MSNDSSMHLTLQSQLHHHAGNYSLSHQDHIRSQDNRVSQGPGREFPKWVWRLQGPHEALLEVPGAMPGLGYSEES